eukprot:3843396-Pyramimonas_sp.AAC.1
MAPLPSQAQAPPHAAPDTSEAAQQRDQCLAAVSLAELNQLGRDPGAWPGPQPLAALEDPGHRGHALVRKEGQGLGASR